MRTKIRLRSLLLCLTTVLTANVALYWLSHVKLDGKVRQVMQEHLTAAYDNSLFSDDKGRVNDAVSIAYIGSQINKQTSTWSESQWYAAHTPANIAIQSVDGIAIGNQPSRTGQVDSAIELVRNQQRRVALISYEQIFQWKIFALLTSGIALIYVGLSSWLPTPFTKVQQRWSHLLIQEKYPPEVAHALAARFRDDQLKLQSLQQELFDLIHSPDKRNFDIALNAALDSRLGALTELDMDWLAATWAASGDLELAWQTALHDDVVEIDLLNALLRIRGRAIEVTKTPLFYYAWYASKRLDNEAEGWMLNPPSNRPDKELGKELSELMWKYKGHARAISELEEHGLRAKSLDQNRSKLKEELIAATGPKLAEHYLFDIDKDDQGRLRYRVKMRAEQIRFLQSENPA